MDMKLESVASKYLWYRLVCECVRVCSKYWTVATISITLSNRMYHFANERIPVLSFIRAQLLIQPSCHVIYTLYSILISLASLSLSLFVCIFLRLKFICNFKVACHFEAFFSSVIASFCFRLSIVQMQIFCAIELSLPLESPSIRFTCENEYVWMKREWWRMVVDVYVQFHEIPFELSFIHWETHTNAHTHTAKYAHCRVLLWSFC